MSLEAATFIEDLVITNPPGSDQKSQGDDHLRLIKTTLRNTLKRASRASYLPVAVAKTANYTVLSTDDNTTFVCDATSGAFTLTPPTLAAGDVGFSFTVAKADASGNPVFISPTGGILINFFSKIRRATAAALTRVFWTGSAWIATRPRGGAIGQILDFHGIGLPSGFLWCDGQSFSATDYVELNATLGTNVTPDLRGRVTVGRDNQGSGDANRITSALSGIDGNTLGAAGGFESIALNGIAVNGGVSFNVVQNPAGSFFNNTQPSLITHKIMLPE